MPTIIWNKKALKEFEEAISYIRSSSFQNAEKVKNDVFQMIESLIAFPERHPPDRDKLNNTKGAFRAFEKYKLRISYFVSAKEIIIISVHHTKQNPKFY